MKKTFIGLFIAACLCACNSEKKEETSKDATKVQSTDDKKAATVLLDLSEADGLRSSMAAFSKGDVDGMVGPYADDVHLQWSGGDSLVGKKAVSDFWKKRWQIIDSLNFSEQIYLPINVNESQSQYAPTGKWVLQWAMVNVKYKNGKKLTFWSHYVNHFNADNKIDFIGMYYDRKPIDAATAGM